MDRPRRAARPPVRYDGAEDSKDPKPPVISGKKRKTQEHKSPADLLLTSPKSALTTMDISEIINAASWSMLSPESQRALKALLPPTAFTSFKPTISPDHPSVTINENEDEDPITINPSSSSSTKPIPNPPSELDTSVFTDPHFLAAAHTFQDHIYSGWLSDSHMGKVNKYLEGIRMGTMSAPRKDEVWERENAVAVARREGRRGAQKDKPVGQGAESGARAGDAAEVKLITLAKNGILRVGDIVALKRNFSGLDLLVEKDAIIQSIHPKTHALTVLLQPGPSPHLPATLLSPTPSDPSPPTQIAVISSPTQLETLLLDSDGRVEKSKRPNGNAWKCMTVWRWRSIVGAGGWEGGEGGEWERAGVEDNGNGRWGRENHGTLFYLRGTYYHEQG